MVTSPPGGRSRPPGDLASGELLELASALVGIPSPTGAEHACARYLRDWLRARGVASVLQRVEPGRANVIATVRGRRGGRTLLLNGHLDTSYAGDPAFDYAGLGADDPANRPEPYLADGALYGLGAFNMKGGLAAMAVAMVQLADGPRLDGSVVFAGVVGESEKAEVPGAIAPRLGRRYRGRGVGTRRFLERAGRIDAAIVAGPSSLRVVNAQAGSLFVEIAVCGSPAYLGRRGGTSAGPIEVAAELIADLRAWGAAYAERHATSTGLGFVVPSVTIGAIEGGWPFAPSTSPGACHVYVDVRVAPGQSSAGAVRELRAVLDACRERHPTVMLAAGVFARGRGTMTPADHPLVQTAIDVLERDHGLDAHPFPDGSADTSNDTNLLRRRGIPSIKLGPSDRFDAAPGTVVGGGPHVTIEDMTVASTLYVQLAHRLVGTSGGHQA